jgi:hypothetical protein
MTLLDSLQAHTEVCEEMYQLMLELNRTLKAGTQTPDADLLERKRAALVTLESSLAELKSYGERRTGTSPEQRSAMEKCQRTILKALLLDRENEQLLLKNAMVRPPAMKPAQPAPGHLAKLYGKHR